MKAFQKFRTFICPTGLALVGFFFANTLAAMDKPQPFPIQNASATQSKIATLGSPIDWVEFLSLGVGFIWAMVVASVAVMVWNEVKKPLEELG